MERTSSTVVPPSGLRTQNRDGWLAPLPTPFRVSLLFVARSGGAVSAQWQLSQRSNRSATAAACRSLCVVRGMAAGVIKPITRARVVAAVCARDIAET
eukprot:6190404-Pleurochrysis_carterae.AAC.2